MKDIKLEKWYTEKQFCEIRVDNFDNEVLKKKEKKKETEID